MYEYITPLFILALWWYDPTLLLKTHSYIRRTSIQIIMSAADLYADFKGKRMLASNEMIKDGYHVNFVYLDIIQEYKIRRIDVTSIFRAEILKGTFQENFALSKFVKICAKPNSNIQTADLLTHSYRLEIDYTFDYKRYRVWFDTIRNPNVIFPIYKESELRKRMFLPKILSAILTNDPDSETGIDVTHKINEAAGPLGNFYDDVNLNVCKERAIPEIGNSNNLYLVMIAHNGQRFIFDKNDTNLTLKS